MPPYAFDRTRIGWAYPRAVGCRLSAVGGLPVGCRLSAVGGVRAADAIGYVAFSTMLPKMEAIQRDAQALDQNIARTVTDLTFKSAWDAWYKNWRENFYEKYKSTVAQAGVVLTAGTDDLDREIDNQRVLLSGYQEGHRQLMLRRGEPVPGPTSTAIQRPELPWWFWIGAGAATAGVGYLIYQSRVKSRESRVRRG
jgi:hypothetical protein